MPVYEYECQRCGRIVENVSRINERLETVQCDKCSGIARRIISLAAVHDDHPVWITPRLSESLCSEGDRPIESRADLSAHCKEHGIVENSKRA